MTQHNLTEAEAVQLLGGVLGGPQASASQGETLGEALEHYRRARRLPLKQMAMALGTPYDTFLRWRGDRDLPDADAVLRICRTIGQGPLVVLRMVAQTARRILEFTLEEGRDEVHAVAARQRGVDVGDGERARVLDLPLPLRRGLAEQHGIAADDVDALSTVLQQAAAADEDARARLVDALVAGLELEGEDDWK